MGKKIGQIAVCAILVAFFGTIIISALNRPVTKQAAVDVVVQSTPEPTEIPLQKVMEMETVTTNIVLVTPVTNTPSPRKFKGLVINATIEGQK